MGNFLTGARYLLRGFVLIRQPGLRRYFVLPLLINVVVFGALLYVGGGQFDALLNWLLPAGDGLWSGIARAVLWLIFAATALIIVFFTFTLVANLLGSPFNGLLAERVERHLTGAGPQASGGALRFLAGIVPAIVGELYKYVYFLIVVVLLSILTVIPVVNFVAPFAWAVFGAWMLVLEYVGYPMENHDHTFKAVRAEARRHRMLSLGFGAAATLATMIPVVNFIVMPAAVAGATAMWVERWRAAAAG